VEILRSVGYGDAEIEAMIASGATLDGRLDKQTRHTRSNQG
jgi:hypothetical protein